MQEGGRQKGHAFLARGVEVEGSGEVIHGLAADKPRGGDCVLFDGSHCEKSILRLVVNKSRQA